MAKESAIKILREFAKDGIIGYEDHCLVIHDAETLRRISQVG